MVGVQMIERAALEHGEGPPLEPDVLAQQRAPRAVILADPVAGEVVDGDGGLGRAVRIGRAHHLVACEVVGVARLDRAVERDARDQVLRVVGIGPAVGAGADGVDLCSSGVLLEA